MAAGAAAGVSYEVYGNGTAEVDERDRLIVALDFGSTEKAQELVDVLGNTVSFYKIGITLQFAGGLEYAERLANQGKRIFLDSKLFDIEEQVRGAVESIDRMGVDFLTVHGSKSILSDAVRGRPVGSDLKIFAVTVLTSLDDDDLRELGFLLSVTDLVDYRTKIAMEAGCDGVIASGLEAAAIRAKVGNRLAIATPGIRPAGVAHDDQKRVAEPYSAIRDGADHLVVGRPIYTNPDPRKVVDEIRRDIGRGLADR